MTQLPAARASVVWTALPDGAVLFATQTEVYYTLNPVGALIWEMLPQPAATLDDICTAVRERYPDAFAEQVQTDVVALLRDLEHCGLVECDE